MDESIAKSKNQNLIALISLVVMLVLLIVIVAYFSKELQVVGDFIRRLGWLGWGTSILIFGLFGATPIPSEPVTVLITTIFGPVSAAIITSLGNLLAAVVEYFLGTRVGNLGNFKKFRENLPFGLGKVPVDSPVFLIGARLIPGYGPKFISLLSGIYKVPFLRYLWTAAVATTLGALIVSFAGHGILSLFMHK